MRRDVDKIEVGMKVGRYGKADPSCQEECGRVKWGGRKQCYRRGGRRVNGDMKARKERKEETYGEIVRPGDLDTPMAQCTSTNRGRDNGASPGASPCPSAGASSDPGASPCPGASSCPSPCPGASPCPPGDGGGKIDPSPLPSLASSTSTLPTLPTLPTPTMCSRTSSPSPCPSPCPGPSPGPDPSRGPGASPGPSSVDPLIKSTSSGPSPCPGASPEPRPRTVLLLSLNIEGKCSQDTIAPGQR